MSSPVRPATGIPGNITSCLITVSYRVLYIDVARESNSPVTGYHKLKSRNRNISSDGSPEHEENISYSLPNHSLLRHGHMKASFPLVYRWGRDVHCTVGVLGKSNHTPCRS